MAHKKLSETVAYQLTYHPEDRLEVFRSLGVPQQSDVMERLSPYIQQSILNRLKITEVVNLLDNMDMQQAKRIVARVSSVSQREKIVNRLKGEVKEKIEYFLRFHPKATLTLINFNYLFLSSDTLIGDAASIIDDHYEETGKYPELLVHENGELVGEVAMSSLVRERNTSTLKKYVREINTIIYQAELNEIIDALMLSGKRKIVVLDQDKSVLGIIYADSAKALFGKMPAESLYDFAGVDDNEKPFDSISKKVNSRYKWLILNLATSFLAGSVVLTFQDTLSAVTILSVYIPIIAGMGGNAATQSFAIMVRGLTLGTISLETAKPAIIREFGAGLINGLIIGSIVAVISFFWNESLMLGVVVGLALICAHVVAGVAGSFIPLLMKHLGKDPAATSTIFITTATDVFGLLFLLGLATLLLV